MALLSLDHNQLSILILVLTEAFDDNLVPMVDFIMLDVGPELWPLPVPTCEMRRSRDGDVTSNPFLPLTVTSPFFFSSILELQMSNIFFRSSLFWFSFLISHTLTASVILTSALCASWVACLTCYEWELPEMHTLCRYTLCDRHTSASELCSRTHVRSR